MTRFICCLFEHEQDKRRWVLKRSTWKQAMRKGKDDAGEPTTWHVKRHNTSTNVT